MLIALSVLMLMCLIVRYYSSYVVFFTSEVVANGGRKTLANYIFSDAANDNGRNMVLRMMGGSYVYF